MVGKVSKRKAPRRTKGRSKGRSSTSRVRRPSKANLNQRYMLDDIITPID